MKIAYLYSGNKPYLGEAKDFWFFSGWKDIDFSVDLINRPFFSPSRYLRALAAFWQSFSLLPKLKNYDVVISEGAFNTFAFSLLRKLVKMEKPLQVVWFVEPWRIWCPGQKLRLKIIKFLLSSVDCILSHSRGERVFWSKLLSRPERCRNVGFGYEPFQVEARRIGDYIFSAGSAARDYPTLVAAAKEVSVRFLIRAGKDNLTGKTGLEKVDVPKNVHLLPELPRKQYLELLANCKFVVVPLKGYLNTAGMNAIMEAMCIGKAVIATKTVGTVDMIIDCETGFLVEPGNVEELKEKYYSYVSIRKKLKELAKMQEMSLRKTFCGSMYKNDV